MDTGSDFLKTIHLRDCVCKWILSPSSHVDFLGQMPNKLDLCAICNQLND